MSISQVLDSEEVLDFKEDLLEELVKVDRSHILDIFPPPGMNKVLEHAHGETDSLGILSSLLNGSMSLFVYSSGWYILSEWGDWVDVIMWNATEPNPEKYLELVEDFALATGKKGVRFISSRKGFQRRCKSLGYSPRMIEYVKEVPYA